MKLSPFAFCCVYMYVFSSPTDNPQFLLLFFVMSNFIAWCILCAINMFRLGSPALQLLTRKVECEKQLVSVNVTLRTATVPASILFFMVLYVHINQAYEGWGQKRIGNESLGPPPSSHSSWALTVSVDNLHSFVQVVFRLFVSFQEG